jgi:cell wall assembly regulator SMI1
VLIEILADLDDDEMTGRWWHPRWIRFGSDGAGNGLVIDDRLAPGGGERGPGVDSRVGVMPR